MAQKGQKPLVMGEIGMQMNNQIHLQYMCMQTIMAERKK